MLDKTTKNVLQYIVDRYNELGENATIALNGSYLFTDDDIEKLGIKRHQISLICNTLCQLGYLTDCEVSHDYDIKVYVSEKGISYKETQRKKILSKVFWTTATALLTVLLERLVSLLFGK